MNHKSSRGALVLACVCLLLSGCADDDDTTSTEAPSAAAASTDVASAPSASASASALEGTWTLHQTKADVAENLERAGFGKHAERFLRTEQVWAQDRWRWEFADGRFTASWMQPDGAWKVADYGTYDTDGRKVSLTFAETAATSTFAWSVSGDQLTLDWTSVDSDPMYKGISDEMFWRAYLTEPLTRAS